jgi:hypothetical protein
MHFWRGISVELTICIGPGCSGRFLRRRPWHTFCSSGCRERYFALARRIGVAILEQAQAGDPEVCVLVERVVFHVTQAERGQ